LIVDIKTNCWEQLEEGMKTELAKIPEFPFDEFKQNNSHAKLDLKSMIPTGMQMPTVALAEMLK